VSIVKNGRSQASSEIPGAGTLENPLAKFMPKQDVQYPAVGENNERYLKKVFVQTWGCQMNVADTERMLALLGTRNYRPTQDVNEADMVLLNTCHIREKARHKVVSRLGELRPLKLQKPELILAVAGCVAQAEAKKLSDEVPYLDLIFGPDQIEELPALLEDVVMKSESGNGKFHRSHETLIKTKFNDLSYSIPIDVVPPWINETKTEVSRYINIIKGCNNFCTFCVVPYTRGREKSRPLDEVVKESHYFVEHGVKEIVLLGQNVNSYGLDLLPESTNKEINPVAQGKLPFADLLYAISEIEGVERIRFTTSNPHDFTRSLAQAFIDLPKVTNHFHLPVQSGSNRILERMNRQYTREEYFERVSWIREARPEIAFSSDIIIGFPGETEEDFEQTIDLVTRMDYSFIYTFKYSPRKGTPATRFKEQVPDDIMDKRLQKLIALQKEITARQNQGEIGKTREVLILYKNLKDDISWYGRTYEGRLVKVISPRTLLGSTVPVLITQANATALMGHPA
jgi:tRNA-2-methylthio-N6-dimethylallyladenosine synthase